MLNQLHHALAARGMAEEEGSFLGGLQQLHRLLQFKEEPLGTNVVRGLPAGRLVIDASVQSFVLLQEAGGL